MLKVIVFFRVFLVTARENKSHLYYMDTIKKYYYDPKPGFSSAERLYKRLQKDGYNISLTTVKDWIKKQNVYQ